MIRPSNIIKQLSLTFLYCVAAPVSSAADSAISNYLDFPYPHNLIAAQKADRLVWVVEHQGRRNVWTAVGPEYEPHEITDYSEDDGCSFEEIAVTSDGGTVVYVRCSVPDRFGVTTNPLSKTDGVRQEIWAVAAEGGEPRLLGHGHSIKISPSDGEITYLNGGQLYISSLSSGASLEEEPAFRARGTVSQPAWSPDGRRIAFVSNRGDHSFVGVYAKGADRIVWMAPDVNRDTHPAWSPDGRRLAFLRFAGATEGDPFDITGATAFEIWNVEVATGEGERFWQSPNDSAGGFAQFYTEDPLQWPAPNTILVYSEHDRYLHVYAISLNNGAVHDLTPGRCITEHISVSLRTAEVFFDSNCGDIDRRHIWKNALAGGVPTQLTDGVGIETYPAIVEDGRGVAFLQANAREPQSVGLLKIDARNAQARRIAPKRWSRDFPLARMVTPEAVKFRALDGTTVHGQLFLPPDAVPAGTEGRRPALVFVHGGPIRQMLLGWHYIDYYSKAYALNQYFASRGYVVLSVNYRGGIGYGQAFRRAENQGPRGASELQDVVAANAYLRSRDDVDGGRIGIWGGSYGGLLTAQALAQHSDLFAAGADLHGVHDWVLSHRLGAAGTFWGLRDAEFDLAKESSPISHVASWRSPVLLIHGDHDLNAAFSQSVVLAKTLRERGVTVETLVFPDEEHNFVLYRNWLAAYESIAEFFEHHL